MSEIKHILSIIHNTIYGAVCLQLTHFPCDDWEDIYLFYYHHQIESMNYYPLFRVRSWNNGLRCMSPYILILNICIQSAKLCNITERPVNYGIKPTTQIHTSLNMTASEINLQLHKTGLNCSLSITICWFIVLKNSSGNNIFFIGIITTIEVFPANVINQHQIQ